MDVKDRKILLELDRNPRISTTKLAKKVLLSQQVTDYRIKKLKEDVINQFGTVLNLSKIGYEQYRVLFQLSASENEKSDLIKYLGTSKNIYWAAIVGGKWDLLTVVYVKNYDEFEDFLDNLFQKFKFIRDYEALYSIYHEFYSHKYLGRNENVIKLNLAASGDNLHIDEIDYCILNNIKSDCRKSSLETGRKCNVSYKTVQQRIEKMENQELIAGYRLCLKTEDYKPYLLLISFQSYGRSAEKKLFSYAEASENVTQATKLFGKWSVMFHLRAKDEKELQKFIINSRSEFKAIGEFEIIPIFEDIAINQFPV